MQAEITSFVPRHWQLNMLSTFTDWYANRQSGDSKTFVAAVTGGAGKTFAGAMIAKFLESYTLLVLVPNNIIANQWQQSLAQQGIDAAIWESDKIYRHNAAFITTYKMMELHAARLSKLVGRGNVVIFDEFHHLAESRSWGDAARLISKNALVRLMLTGTAFREDDAPIPLVQYKDGQLVTNFEYNYGQALEDGFVRPIYFRAFDAQTHWQYDLDRYQSDFTEARWYSESMRAVINPKSEWVKAVIKEANSKLDYLRKKDPTASGIITCATQEHARKIHRLIQQITHTNPVLAISDDTDSDAKIEHFRNSDDHWLVVVRKGGEGLDIPRLRVGVWASNITKQLSFYQFLWRIVRGDDDCHFFMPAHPQLLEYAKAIREMRLHTLAPEALLSPEDEKRINTNGRAESSSSFEAIAAETGERIEWTTQTGKETFRHDPVRVLRQIAEFSTRALFNLAENCSDTNSELGRIHAEQQLMQLMAMLQPHMPDIEKPQLEIIERAEERKNAHEQRLMKNQQRLWQNTLSKVRGLSPLNKDALLTILFDASRAWHRDELATVLACSPTSINIGELIRTNLVRLEIGGKNRYRSNLEKHIEFYPNLPNHDFLGDIASIVEKK